MATFNDNDFDYVQNQFSSLTHHSLECVAEEQQDPWKFSLTPDIILNDVDLPAIYNDYYTRLSNQHAQYLVTTTTLEFILQHAGLDSTLSEKIITLIHPTTSTSSFFPSSSSPAPLSTITRQQFNLAIALLACSQNGLDLPIPKLNEDVFTTLMTTTTYSKVPSTSNSSFVSTGLTLDSPTIAQLSHQHNDNDNDIHDTIDTGHDRKAIHVDGKNRKETVKDYQWFLDLDLVTVTQLPEKEGRLFKHVNYLVSSQHGTLAVTRRFNDFYLLWESLLKRYPLRSVPKLPPKKIKGSNVFLENRRHGLFRFMNALVRHPILAQDELVKAFLEENDIQDWWQQYQPSMEDEFIRTMPMFDSLLSNIPHDITDRLKRIERRIVPAIQQYDKMIIEVQRLASNNQADANDLIRYSITLNAMNEMEQQSTHHQHICESCEQISHGQEKVAHSMQAIAGLLDGKASSMFNTFLEHLNYQRDLFISFKDMLERKDELIHAISQQRQVIPKAIAAQMVLTNSNTSPSSPVFPISVYQHHQERRLTNQQIDTILQSDHIRESLHQHRMLFIQYCLASELSYLHRQQVFISLMYQDMVRQQHTMAKEQQYQWQTLQRELETMMPDDPDSFD
ncbi:uncharacterized protein BX664DRAFT_313240 [Halteromyces radiatus]|uniref:uncharacterized protein n=1 Tax=Halteromyces radiatus TaxID=101107 RepID=UPI00221E91B6|nr:uncharacterized protein BX664DRAFT_313240 [Halteromyces radiatus]KAI8093153.1 hypothetical protein BX664DRAFT_313240 [Halteromyces radiatus]